MQVSVHQCSPCHCRHSNLLAAPAHELQRPADGVKDLRGKASTSKDERSLVQQSNSFHQMMMISLVVPARKHSAQHIYISAASQTSIFKRCCMALRWSRLGTACKTARCPHALLPYAGCLSDAGSCHDMLATLPGVELTSLHVIYPTHQLQHCVCNALLCTLNVGCGHPECLLPVRWVLDMMGCRSGDPKRSE